METLVREAWERFDEINRGDPVMESSPDGDVPRDWLYGRRMSSMLAWFFPSASSALQLAVRAQHLARYALPREQYPMNRAGYHRWRNEQKALHSRRAAEVLRELGAKETLITHVQRLVEKRNLRSDPEAQALEDVACLVFLRYHLDDFAAKHQEEKTVSIVAKSMEKMSEQGRNAVQKLVLTKASTALLEKAAGEFCRNHGDAG